MTRPKAENIDENFIYLLLRSKVEPWEKLEMCISVSYLTFATQIILRYPPGPVCSVEGDFPDFRKKSVVRVPVSCVYVHVSCMYVHVSFMDIWSSRSIRDFGPIARIAKISTLRTPDAVRHTVYLTFSHLANGC